MRADLVVDHAHNATPSVLARETDVYFVFARLGVVRDTGGRNLPHLEVDAQVFGKVHLVNVLLEYCFSLFLLDQLSLGFKIRSLRAKLLNEGI